MKISELNELLKTYSDSEFKIVLKEIYKMIPKKTKEEKNIDELLKNPALFLENQTINKQLPNIANINILKKEIETFLSNADNGYYFNNNKVISKQDRPKWRFEVKRFVKELDKIGNEDVNIENIKIASDLIEKLYSLIVESCSRYYFPSENSFKSICVTQIDFFKILLKLKFKSGEKELFIKECILSIISGYTDDETCKSDLVDILMESITDTVILEKTIEKCNEICIELDKEFNDNYMRIISENKNCVNTREIDSKRYSLNEKMGLIAEIGFGCYIKLEKQKDAMDYFKKTSKESKREVKLHMLLRLIFQYELKDLWVSVFENAQKSNIKPRKNLIDTYEKIKTTGELPSSMYY